MALRVQPASIRVTRERHEADRHCSARAHLPARIFFDDAQFLPAPLSAHWNHESAAWFQLRDQRWRHFRCRGGNDDRIEWRMLGPSAITVAAARVHVAITERRQARGRLL